MTVSEREGDVVATLPPRDRLAKITAAVDRLVAWLTRHWLALFNVVAALFIAPAFLAPALMHLGATGTCDVCPVAARVIYTAYSPTCHQLPERSFYLFGPQLTYRVSELEALAAFPAGLSILQREFLRWVGMPATGYKVAICQRDVAIYGSILVSGFIFGVVRRRIARPGVSLPKMPLWAYGLLLAPMAVDGITQLIGWRESSWPLRTVTGALFGGATVWLAYPYVQDAMDDVAAPARSSNRSSQQRSAGIGQKPQDEV